jgi:hypothetical protein
MSMLLLYHHLIHAGYDCSLPFERNLKHLNVFDLFRISLMSR